MTLKTMKANLTWIWCLCAFFINMFANWEIGMAANLNPQFADILNGRASIRYFKVAFPGNLFIANNKPIQGWVYYEGAIQNNTFWIRNCTNSPHDSGQILPGWIVGMSQNEYWDYRDDAVAISPRGSKTESPLDKRANETLFFVRKALGIGASVNPGSFRLGTNNNFYAKSGNEIIRGHFSVAVNGYPTRCEYSDESRILSKAKAVVEYTYSTNSDFPVGFVATIFRGPIEIEKTEYRILACELGNDPKLPANGYTVDFMTNFGGVNLRVRDLVGTTVWRGGKVYLKPPKGEMKLVNDNLAEEQMQTSHRRLFILALMCATTISLIWLVVRSRRVCSQ